MTGATRCGKILVCYWAFSSLVAGARAEAEIIGFWDVVAPSSAHLVTGGGGTYFDWLNVVNAPVTIEEAFTGHPMLDDGYANFSTDTILELDYGPGVLRNDPGDDLVLFDARFDANSYSVTASFDGFASQLLLPSNAFVYTGESRLYYYAGLDLPYTATIWAVPFDLSALGVSDGATVASIRVRSLEDDGGDLIGVGAIRGVAEPSSVLLLLGGLALVVWRRRR